MPLRATSTISVLLALVGFSLSLAFGAPQADVVPVVSSLSPVATLSRAQLTDIFLGKVKRFPDGTLAIAIDQPEGSHARDEFYLAYAEKSPAQVKSYWAKIVFTGRGQPPRIVSNNSDIRKVVAADPRAISYIERSAVDGTVRIVQEP